MHIAVFDFDDTLFPTSYVNMHMSADGTLDTETHKKLEKVLSKVNDNLNLVRKYVDKIIVISNASIEWIDIWWQKYFNKQQNDIQIVSTVSSGNSANRPYHTWKQVTFLAVLNKYFGDGDIHYLYAFGDCPFDRMAAFFVNRVFPNVIVRNLLLITHPTVEELSKEHDFLQHKIPELIQADHSVNDETDMKFVRAVVPMQLPFLFGACCVSMS